MHLASGKWKCMARLLVLTLNVVNFEFFVQKMPQKWSKLHFLTDNHRKWFKNDPKMGDSTRKRRLYVNSLRRGRGGEFISIFWNFFSNSSTFFWKKCHFWRLISRDLGLPNGSNYPFWVGKCFFYVPLFDADTWKCTVLELWALEVGIKIHFFGKLRKPLIFEGTYTKNWAIYGGQTCFED